MSRLSADIDALAVDYDRTLTGPDELEPVPAAVAALRQARSRGKRVVLVSGRRLDEIAPAARDAVDVVVAENGCVMRTPDGSVLRLCDADPRLGAALADAGLDAERGLVVASIPERDALVASLALDRAGIRADLEWNRDRVMILPPGAGKASGLLAALGVLRVEPRRAAAVGDAENDVAMLRGVAFGIAVRNATPEVKGAAHVVTREPGGWGVARWVTESWLGGDDAP